MYKIKIEKDGEKFCKPMKTDRAFMVLTKNENGNTVITSVGSGEDLIDMIKDVITTLIIDLH